MASRFLGWFSRLFFVGFAWRFAGVSSVLAGVLGRRGGREVPQIVNDGVTIARAISLQAEQGGML